MLRDKFKRWFGFPLATENLKEVQSILEERLREIEMAEKKVAKKKAPANKKAPVKKKAPAKKKAPVKKSGGGREQQAL